MTTMTEDQIAAQMYPSMAKEPVQQQQQAPASTGDPVKDQAIKDARTADVLFSSTTYKDATLHDESSADPSDPKAVEALKAANEQWRDQLYEWELSEPEGQEVTNLVRATTEPVPEAEQQEHLQAVRTNLVMMHGEDGAKLRLDAVKALAARSPVLVQTLVERGLLNHPRVAAVALERAWSMKLKGLL